MTIRPRAPLLLICAFLLLLAGCSTNPFRTGAHFDTEYDFSAVDSFAFAPQRAKAAASKNGKLLEAAIRSELTQRGYTEVPKAEAKVLISYDIGVYSQAQLTGGRFSRTEGGVTVSVLDPNTKQTVWYGWAEKVLTPKDEAEAAINDAVRSLFDGRIPEAPEGAG